MTINFSENKNVNATIYQLQSSDFKFYLTGSRFFGNFTKYSDWDFFVKDSLEVRNFLQEIGFSIHLKDYTYKDRNLNFIVCHNNVPIQIQLVNDADLKICAQVLLFETDELRNVQDKSKRSYIWNKALDTIVRLRQIPEISLL